MLNETHESLKRIGVSTDEMDVLVQEIQQTKGVLGARMMGGGFGGMILVLVESENILPHADLISPSRPGFVEERL
jgi:galactokinase